MRCRIRWLPEYSPNTKSDYNQEINANKITIQYSNIVFILYLIFTTKQAICEHLQWIDDFSISFLVQPGVQHFLWRFISSVVIGGWCALLQTYKIMWIHVFHHTHSSLCMSSHTLNHHTFSRERFSCKMGMKIMRFTNSMRTNKIQSDSLYSPTHKLLRNSTLCSCTANSWASKMASCANVAPFLEHIFNWRRASSTVIPRTIDATKYILYGLYLMFSIWLHTYCNRRPQ